MTIKTIDTSWLKDSVEDSYTAFIDLSLEEQLKLFGQVTALSVDSSSEYCKKNSIYAQLNERCQFKKTNHWNPTKKNFFSRVRLNVLQNICAQLFGEVWMQEHIKLKKSVLAELAEKNYLNIELDKKAFLPDVMV